MHGKQADREQQILFGLNRKRVTGLEPATFSLGSFLGSQEESLSCL